MTRPKTCILVPAPVEAGAGRRGADMGARAFRAAGLAETLRELGLEVVERRRSPSDRSKPGAIPIPPFAILPRSRPGPRRSSRPLTAAAEGMPIFLGGDHSLAAGTLAGVSRRAPSEGESCSCSGSTPIPTSTPSTAPKRQSARRADGLCHRPRRFRRLVPAARRAGEAGEHLHDGPAQRRSGRARGARAQPASPSTTCAPSTSTASAALVSAFLDRVARADGILHVSLDVDFLDPAIAPGVGTTVPGGASFREAHLVMEMLHDSGLVSSLDLVELNPFLDERGRTALLLVDLVASLMGRRVLDGRPGALAMTPPLNLVPFVSVDHMMRLVQRDRRRALSGRTRRLHRRGFPPLGGSTRRRASPRISADGVIELMPTSDGAIYGFKYVNGHPKNTREGRQTVTAFGVLADVGTGYPVLLTEMTILTALRTAATSALAAKYLAPAGARSMAIIGNGAQSEFQALAFKALLGVDRLRLYDIDRGQREMRRATSPRSAST